MAHYKIKNITGNLGRRHVNKDSILKIEYQVGFHKKYKDLTVGNEIVLSCRMLPVSIHSLRAKKLITVTEINENEFVRLQKPSAKKSLIVKENKKEPAKLIANELVVVVPIEGEEIKETTKKETTKKRSTRKSKVKSEE